MPRRELRIQIREELARAGEILQVFAILGERNRNTKRSGQIRR